MIDESSSASGKELLHPGTGALHYKNPAEIPYPNDEALLLQSSDHKAADVKSKGSGSIRIEMGIVDSSFHPEILTCTSTEDRSLPHKDGT
jgi:hypothetical protein